MSWHDGNHIQYLEFGGDRGGGGGVGGGVGNGYEPYIMKSVCRGSARAGTRLPACPLDRPPARHAWFPGTGYDVDAKGRVRPPWVHAYLLRQVGFLFFIPGSTEPRFSIEHTLPQISGS